MPVSEAEIQHGVLAAALGKEEEVRPGAAAEPVIPISALEAVVSGAAEQLVIAVAADQGVVAVQTANRVVSVAGTVRGGVGNGVGEVVRLVGAGERAGRIAQVQARD